jgi:steroid delta-isomerase-like uncharacterized protein
MAGNRPVLIGSRAASLSHRIVVFTSALLLMGLVTACDRNDETSGSDDMTDFATRYAAAWSSGDPARLASFYAEDGSITVNDGEPAVGRTNVEATARSFMTAFPDMVVALVRVDQDGEEVIFHWHWTGTNTGPGGTGNAVDLTGYERWTMSADGLIRQSLGYYDNADYERQVNATSGQPN